MKEVRMQPRTNTTARHLVGSYPSYGEAEKVVDALGDDGFPVEHLTIVAEELRFVEDVTGRRGYLDEGLGGAASGALIGASLGFVLGLFSLVDPLISGLALAVYGALFGAVIGVLVGVLSHWISAGRRDFTSRRSLEAGRYDIVADTADHGDDAARRVLSRVAVSSS